MYYRVVYCSQKKRGGRGRDGDVYATAANIIYDQTNERTILRIFFILIWGFLQGVIVAPNSYWWFLLVWLTPVTFLL